MSTKWVVTTPSDRIELDEAQQGQISFTVTNPTDRVDRVAFDIVPQDGADPSWFSVDEPQRRVPAGGSVSYVMKVAIPPTASPGAYSVQGRAYSADSAPEEDSVLSSRLAVEVKPKAAPPPRKRFPWWIPVVAALVVVVLVVVLVLVFSGGGKPAATPSAKPTGEQVTMPDLINQSGQQATNGIVAFGLSVGRVRYVLVNDRPNRIVYQSVPGGVKVAKGTQVDLVVATALAKPVIASPASTVPVAAVSVPVTPVPTTPVVAASGSPGPATTGPAKTGPAPTAAAPSASATAPAGVITWTDSDTFVKHWLVSIQRQICVTTQFTGCITLVTSQAYLDRPSYTPILPPAETEYVVPSAPANAPYYPLPPPSPVSSTNVFVVTVAPVDDFGHAGPAADARTFTVV